MAHTTHFRKLSPRDQLPAPKFEILEDFQKVAYAGRTTKFTPGKSLRFFELFLELSLFEFRFTVFFTLGCGVDS